MPNSCSYSRAMVSTGCLTPAAQYDDEGRAGGVGRDVGLGTAEAEKDNEGDEEEDGADKDDGGDADAAAGSAGRNRFGRSDHVSASPGSEEDAPLHKGYAAAAMMAGISHGRGASCGGRWRSGGGGDSDGNGDANAGAGGGEIVRSWRIPEDRVPVGGEQEVDAGVEILHFAGALAAHELGEVGEGLVVDRDAARAEMARPRPRTGMMSVSSLSEIGLGDLEHLDEGGFLRVVACDAEEREGQLERKRRVDLRAVGVDLGELDGFLELLERISLRGRRGGRRQVCRRFRGGSRRRTGRRGGGA